MNLIWFSYLFACPYSLNSLEDLFVNQEGWPLWLHFTSVSPLQKHHFDCRHVLPVQLLTKALTSFRRLSTLYKSFVVSDAWEWTFFAAAWPLANHMSNLVPGNYGQYQADDGGEDDNVYQCQVDHNFQLRDRSFKFMARMEFNLGWSMGFGVSSKLVKQRWSLCCHRHWTRMLRDLEIKRLRRVHRWSYSRVISFNWRNISKSAPSSWSHDVCSLLKSRRLWYRRVDKIPVRLRKVMLNCLIILSRRWYVHILIPSDSRHPDPLLLGFHRSLWLIPRHA